MRGMNFTKTRLWMITLTNNNSKQAISASHDMRTKNIQGKKLLLCSRCGASYFRKKWRFAGFESKTEPPCINNINTEYTTWKSNASEIKDDGEI